MPNHQTQQKKLVNQIEKKIKDNSLNFSTVSPIEDYDSDPRLCLTSVHFPHEDLVEKIQNTLIKPLKNIEPNFYYYSPQSLHMTIKNIRVINSPPQFNLRDIETAKKVFCEVVPKHQKIEVYFYKLLLFPNSLSIIGTTQHYLDELVIDLDINLKKNNLADDKIYANSNYFFSNITLVRFNTKLLKEFTNKVKKISDSLNFKPFIIDSVSLVSTNAVFKNPQIFGTWSLK